MAMPWIRMAPRKAPCATRAAEAGETAPKSAVPPIEATLLLTREASSSACAWPSCQLRINLNGGRASCPLDLYCLDSSFYTTGWEACPPRARSFVLDVQKHNGQKDASDSNEAQRRRWLMVEAESHDAADYRLYRHDDRSSARRNCTKPPCVEKIGQQGKEKCRH